ncbi:MAG: NifB/NifX family molybdenum-iron cluster-binding protein [Candidatus Omnitrophota bacterium]|jgi:predicted Fe-Mo cluster-binding NifX family protein
MKICVTSEGKSLDSPVDSRFGRCSNFIFFDTDTGGFEAQENSGLPFQGGAGIQAGQLAVSKGVTAVLTGNVGPNAYRVLASAGISVFTGVSGTVKEAIEGYRNGKYKAAEAPSAALKSGTQVKNE